MKAENIIGLAIYVVVALFMVAIGIAQLKSKDPVGFYSGEEPPKAESLTDVSTWNKRHGMMWLIYGIIIFVCSLNACESKSFRKKSSWRIFFEKFLVISSDSFQIVGESKGKGFQKILRKGEKRI